MNDTKINENHKDRLFCFIFGQEKNKEWILELYNAVNHSNYTDSNDIEINTLGDALFMGMKNDVSFLLNCSLNLYEHQSTYNPNMPVRQLMYLSSIYDKYIKINKLNIYGSKRIQLPVPKFITFYNGLADTEDETELILEDLLQKKEALESDVTVRVRMLNINFGHNKEILEACKPLSEYAWLINRIRFNSQTMEIQAAVNKALDEMLDSFTIKKFLIENRSEVEMRCLTEYNEAEVMNLFKEEGREEGLAEGAAEREKLKAENDQLLTKIAKLEKKLAEVSAINK